MSRAPDPRLQNPNPEAQLQHYSQTAIPTALMDLSGKHQYVNQVIQYCEQSYMVQNKDEIERQTKNYLTDALEAVVKDIELIAANLSQFVDLQAGAIDSLTSQLDMIRTRMELAREHQAYNRLNQMRRERSQPAPVSTSTFRSPAVRYLQGEEVPQQAQKMAAFSRVPMSARLGSLDDVGICLHREEAARTDFSSVTNRGMSSTTSAPPAAAQPPSMLSKNPSMGAAAFASSVGGPPVAPPTLSQQSSYSAPPPSSYGAPPPPMTSAPPPPMTSAPPPPMMSAPPPPMSAPAPPAPPAFGGPPPPPSPSALPPPPMMSPRSPPPPPRP